MRVELEPDRRFAGFAAWSAALGGAALGALLGGYTGALAGVLAGGLFGAFLWRRAGARSRRRRELAARPFPPRWRELLLTWSDHYERMDPAWRARFERDVLIFLAETRITGIRAEVTDELRLLVAASAVTLSVGWPDYEWSQLTEVLLYPDDFDRDYRLLGEPAGDESQPWDGGALERAGEAHAWGSVILSVPSLEESFDVPDDAYHVGLHEFAHLLDMDETRFDGIPAGLSEEQARDWTAVATKEMERLGRGGRSVFDEYGADSPVEFFGVAVEAFFEVPQRVRRHHPDVYRLLCGYFRQDPAAWDDARGLRD